MRRGAAPIVAPATAADGDGVAEFEAFVRDAEPRLRRAPVAAYGFEEGRDATAEALAYAWEHWGRVRAMPNAAGYLFRVAQSGRRRRRVPVQQGGRAARSRAGHLCASVLRFWGAAAMRPRRPR